MAGRGGFQPCTLDEGIGPVLPQWEKSVVLTALFVHVADVALDILVVLLFLSYLQWGFLISSAGVVLGAWVVSGLYVSFGASGAAAGGLSERNVDRLQRFFLNFTQIQIFTEAYRCVAQGGETDYFHTLRLLEALLESAPNALVQLYALTHWAGGETAPPAAVPLLRASILVSFLSVGIGLAMWEQKVQFRASCGYIVGVAVLRAFEVAARTLTLALFAGLTHPFGLVWALAFDYAVMVFIVARHRSVHLTYGFFVALPLVLVSLEPFVWRRQDHAVPKDAYYAVRVIEALLMWAVIVHGQGDITAKIESYYLWVAAEALAVISTVGLYCLLPFIWKAARRQELSRDVDDWGDDDGKGDGEYSDSEGVLSGEEETGGLVAAHDRDLQGELPPE